MGRGKGDRDARSVLLGRNRMRPVVDQEWFDTSEYIRTTLAGYPFLRGSGKPSEEDISFIENNLCPYLAPILTISRPGGRTQFIRTSQNSSFDFGKIDVDTEKDFSQADRKKVADTIMTFQKIDEFLPPGRTDYFDLARRMVDSKPADSLKKYLPRLPEWSRRAYNELFFLGEARFAENPKLWASLTQIYAYTDVNLLLKRNKEYQEATDEARDLSSKANNTAGFQGTEEQVKKLIAASEALTNLATRIRLETEAHCESEISAEIPRIEPFL